MSGSDSSESESSEASHPREKSPASSPKRHKRTSPSHRRNSPPRRTRPLAQNAIPRPRFSTLLSEDELASQQHEMYRRNLPLRGPDPGLPLPITVLLEQKLALQHVEIQRLLNDNQQLLATHVILRQELAAMQEQLQHQREISLTETGKDEQIRTLVERVSKQQLDLRAMDSLKDDLEKLLVQRQELSLKAHGDALQLATLKSQIDGLHKELQHSRQAYEQERKVSADHLLHRQAMEKSYHSVLEEVGRLRIELANIQSRSHGANYGSLPIQSFDTGNTMQQESWGYQSVPGQDPMSLMNRQPYYPGKNITPAGLSNGQNVLHDKVAQMTNDSTAGIGWSVHTASNGQHFYYNTSTGVTQWEKPVDVTSEDQHPTKVPMQPVQQGNSQHSMQFSASQQQVLEPNQSAWSAQTNTHAHYTQASTGVPGKSCNYLDQAAAQTSGQS